MGDQWPDAVDVGGIDADALDGVGLGGAVVPSNAGALGARSLKTGVNALML
jgi:hypothetical protein